MFPFFILSANILLLEGIFTILYRCPIGSNRGIIFLFSQVGFGTLPGVGMR